MRYRTAFLALLASIVLTQSPLAQHAQRYTAPRTDYGRPDLQGVWATAFMTPLERPAGADSLVVSAEQAKALVTTLRSRRPALIDPDFQIHNVQELAMVNGEYRTSIIVEPKDGKIPFTPAGLELLASIGTRKTDNPEQRPLSERCLENFGYAPIRAVPVLLPRQIVQTRDALVIMSEDAVGLRVIHLSGAPPPATIRTIEGYSSGRWEGDTLVVQTDHLRADDPSRGGQGRAVLLSRQTRITERFTRVSPTELFYQFTVEDGTLYTQPWAGEFSFTRYDGRTYEYACHEANYSLPSILRGGQAEAARAAAGKTDK